MSTPYAGPPQGQYPPPQPPEQRKKRRTMPLWVFIVALVVTMFASCGVGAVAGGEADTPERSSATGATTAELDRREKALEERNEKLNDRHADLNDREAKLDERKAAIDEREKKLQGEEKTQAANTISGDGTYVVGDDIKPGTYKSTDNGELCYWARLSDTSGQGIITNGLGGGQHVVTIAKSDEAFQTSDCRDWKRQ